MYIFALKLPYETMWSTVQGPHCSVLILISVGQLCDGDTLLFGLDTANIIQKVTKPVNLQFYTHPITKHRL